MPIWLSYLKTLPLYLLPHGLFAKGMYRLSQCRIPWIKNTMIRLFIRFYKVNMEHAQIREADQFEHFNGFFTRAVRRGSRPLDNAVNAVVSPVDATVSEFGTIDGARLLQVKGKSYSLRSLLAGRGWENFQNGTYLTLYLAPADYHRVHMPLAGKLVEANYIPGRLFPVNSSSVRVVNQLFCRNERLCCRFDTAAGDLLMLLVGAFFVGGIESVWHGAVNPSHHGLARSLPGHPDRLDKGAEMGRFKMGSTVILLFQPGMVEWQGIRAGQAVKMGQAVGHLMAK